MKVQKSPQKPYFARFLERQELARTAAGMTLKYPSDDDEYASS